MTQDTFLLVTTAKDEGPTILEWVAHHRLCGFDHIQIHQFDSNDTTAQSLRILDRLGVIELLQDADAGGDPLERAFEIAADSDAFAQSDWCMALDANEFLNVSIGAGRVSDLAQTCADDIDAILVNQRLFGANGNTDLRINLVTERFTTCEPGVEIAQTRMSPFRALFRTSAFGGPGSHLPTAPVDPIPALCNASGLQDGMFTRTDSDSFDPGQRQYAQINKYAARDIGSFLVRKDWPASRTTAEDVSLDGWKAVDRNDSTDLTLAERRRALWAEMKRLDALSNGRLLKLRKRAVRMWRRKATELLEQADYAALRDDILAAPRPEEGLSVTPFRLPGTHRRTPVFSSSRAEFDEIEAKPKKRPLILRGAS